MLIISARENENNRWKRKVKKQGQNGTKGWEKVWELNDFVVRLSKIFCN